jgi:hypothetical protein
MAYGPEGPQFVYAQSIAATSSASVNFNFNAHAHASAHASAPSATPGSAHTALHMQAGFAPGPSYAYPAGLRSYPDLASMPTIDGSPEPSPPAARDRVLASPPARDRLLTNPLPEPPRRSTYMPPPPLELAPAARASGEYWPGGVPVAAST